MPVTFFAHQVPVLPVARRWPGKTDGVALVIGSMAPDLAYVINGSRFEIWAHDLPWVITFCVPVTVCLSWIIVRVLAPVVPAHLPQLGNFRLQEYRGLATHRFGVVTTPVCAFVGALSHVMLDSFTHGWGWFARHVDWYDDVIIEGAWFGRPLTVFRTLQYVGHVGGTTLCLWLLWRYGSQGWMTARAARVPVRRTPSSTAALWSAVAAGVTAALVWAGLDSQGFATDLLRISAGAFAGMTVGALVVRAGTPNSTSSAADHRADAPERL
ncbi:MAG TPA: DUF4184 family protein [Ilumatobacteraceae bacterium]|nr:DUF4184 family protein [Ilumatobacteraceae bacterium]